MELKDFQTGVAVFTTDGKSPALSVVHMESGSDMVWVKWQPKEGEPTKHTVLHLSQLTHTPPAQTSDLAGLAAQESAAPAEAPAAAPAQAEEVGDK